jgi:glutamyl-tRNA(Gln) amidotransferase subunit E
VETKVSATVIAVALTETLKALRRDGVNVEAVTDGQFREMFRLIGEGKTAKESIPEVLTWLASHEEASAKAALKSLGLGMMSRKELEDLVDDVIEKNSEFVELRGKGAFGPLMGIVMKKARGRVKAQLVNEILRKRLEDTID